MSKRFFRSFLSSMLALLMIVSLAAIPSSAAGIALSKTSLSLTKGYATTLSVSGTSSKVTWSTGDKSIATVSSSGKVTGKALGSTYIYAKVSGTTLKCKVTVVAGKITASKSKIDLDEGEKATITIKATGTHALSLGSTNKSVVKAAWGSKKFDGDTIKITLTAGKSGTARVKIYATKYSSTVYKYIDVTVGDNDLIIDDNLGEEPGNTTSSSVSLSTQNVNVKSGGTASVYSYGNAAVGALSSNTSVATVAVKNSYNGQPGTITISGVGAGTAKVRVYLQNDTRKYTDINVTVEGGLQYYTVLNTEPAYRISDSDYKLTLNINGTTRWMLVPYESGTPNGYDIAKVNNVVAKYENGSRYYTVYSDYPAKKTATDDVHPFVATIAGSSVYRYVLIPAKPDQVTLNTVLAQYTGKYEYYEVYNSNPVKQYSSDSVQTWQTEVTDPSTGKTQRTTRYMLLPYGYDKEKADGIISKDKNSASPVKVYTVLTEAPTNYDHKAYELIAWKNETANANRYMIVPKNNCDFVKRNDAIYSDTGVFCYYNAYSKVPYPYLDEEEVWPVTVESGGASKQVFIVVNTLDNDYQDKWTKAISGSAYNWTKSYCT